MRGLSWSSWKATRRAGTSAPRSFCVARNFEKFHRGSIPLLHIRPGRLGRSVRRPYAEIRRQVPGQGEAAEEQGGVDRVAGERVPEEGGADKVARREACAGVRVVVRQGPDAEVGDQEKLQSRGM